MKSSFAFAIIAAVAACLLGTERITATPPAAPPAVPCKECCEGTCCKEKSPTATATIAKPCADGQCADGQCADGQCADGQCANGQCANGQCANGQCASAACDCSGQKQASVDAYITLPLPPAAPSPISIAALPQPCPSAGCNHSACSGIASPTSAIGTTCTEQNTVIYSAMPLGVPSPFAKDPEFANPQRFVIAAQPHSFNIPLPQPPVPLAHPSSDVIMEHRLAYAPVTPASHAVEPAATATQVLYNIQIIQDREGCLSEYESFRDGDCIMFADSETLLPALRILQKHELVQGLSSPKLICTTGHRAQFEVGREVAGDEKSAWEGVKLEVEAEQHQNGLKVDLAVHTSHDERTCDVRTAVVVECGKSVVLKSQGTAGCNAEGAQPAIYVIVTPEVIRQ
jgi:hypothetical protein